MNCLPIVDRELRVAARKRSTFWLRVAAGATGVVIASGGLGKEGYFAFNGAYADVPGGAAGEDPVGPAVRALRAKSKSLADFINTIGWMTSFQQLQHAIQK